MEKIIEVSQLTRSYGSMLAVDGVSFEVFKGEVFGFLGPNGAGKSTTINMLCTTLKVSSGTARINGFDIIKETAQVRENIGIIFQEASLDDKLTALENMKLHCVMYQVPRQIREQRINNVLNIVELWDRRNSLVNTYSGGMKRRLEIARGLLHYPKVLFLDEPTIGLDPQTRSHIWQYITDLRKSEGITVFLTTHYMEEAEQCDRIAIMDSGKIVALDTPANLKSQVGGDAVVLKTADDNKSADIIRERYRVEVSSDQTGLRFHVQKGQEFLAPFIKEFPVPILNISMYQPTLNDVFLKITGKTIRDEEASKSDIWKNEMRRNSGRH